MIKVLLSGAAAASALLAWSPATAAPGRPEAPAWVIVPGAETCRAELEFAGASGAVVPAALVSDGVQTDLVFARPDTPEQAFLPIRIDHKPYANLVMRQGDGRSAMQLSPETLAALRKGAALQISWLAQEPVQIGLAGSDQALTDLGVCGAQVAERFRAREAARREAQARAEAEARARAVADEQLAAAKAQKAAAEAEADRAAAEAERLRAEAQRARQRVEQQARADAYSYAPAYASPDPRELDYPPPSYPRYVPPPYRRW